MGEQSEAFLRGEGNAWYHRNKTKKREDEVIPILMELGIEPRSVLEIGCSDGRRLAVMQHYYPSAKLKGIDPSEDAIYAANKKTSGIVFCKDTANDVTGSGAEYDLVIFGFCLYLVDRDALTKMVRNVDYMLEEWGHIIIHDFDPSHPHKIRYEHDPSFFSYKMDHSALFLCNPTFRLIKKVVFPDQTAIWVIQKISTEEAYPEEELNK